MYPQESNTVYQGIISTLTKQKVSIVYEMTLPISVYVKQKDESIRMLIHKWYLNYGNSLLNIIRNFTNWLARTWDGRKNKFRDKKSNTKKLHTFYFLNVWSDSDHLPHSHTNTHTPANTKESDSKLKTT